MRPSAPTRRPESAQSRRDDEASPEPSAQELDDIERHLAALPLHAGGRAWQDDDLGLLIVRVEPPGQGHDLAAMVRWPAGELRDRLAALERHARADGTWPSLLLAEGLSRPADLPARVAEAGWSQLRQETTMWTRRPVAVPHLDPRLRLEAATERSVAEYEALERRIFGLPAWDAAGRVRGLSAGIAGGTLRAFLVRSGGVAVAVARLSLLYGSAGLYGIGVAPERRREGLGGFVTAVAMRAALARGGSLVWLSVENDNAAARRLYERLGFRPAFGWSRWLAPPR
ncbi:MAG: GNAT family N-acetyltransferase [Chloroflexota bacterium]|nr:GNAT family N-acetyltransferase [Chloroflexota bacterium]